MATSLVTGGTGLPEFTRLHLDIIEHYFILEPSDFVCRLASPASLIDHYTVVGCWACA
jgi:hypothetical protein